MQEPCFVKTGTVELTNEVVEMAKRAGFDHPHASKSPYYKGVCFGSWSDEYPWPGFYFISGNWYIEEWRHTGQPRKHWPDFDASTEAGMAALKAYWFPEEQFDESPLPHFTMDKDKEKELRLRFNMSEDQWEALPPIAREALAGAKVEIKEFMPFKWIPIGVKTRAMEDTQSVVFTSGGRGGTFDCQRLAVGWFDCAEDDKYIPHIAFGHEEFEDDAITHYAQLPTEELPSGESPIETQEPEWQ